MVTTVQSPPPPRPGGADAPGPSGGRSGARPTWYGRKIGYIPALDGMRAVAVALVVAYHLGYSGVAGGYIGVEVFFVLSGWLVCALLMNERQRTGGIALTRFWVRRARRLLPALALVVAATLLVSALVDPGGLAELRSQAAAALTYHLNWRLIVDQQSYFEAAGGPSALEHLWSLSIEEQFYAVFPLLAAYVLARRGRVSAVRIVVLLALCSTVLRLLVYDPGLDPSRVYFGTDTRLAGLLGGVALGLFWTPDRLRPHTDRWFRRALDVTALAGAVVVGWYTLGLDESQGVAFQGGFTAAQVATLAVLAVAVHPAPTATARLLSVAPLRWVGQRSYGIYLAHWPVIVFLSAAPGEQPDGPVAVVGEVALILVLAALSYRFVEQPVRVRGFRRSAGDAGRWLLDAAAGRPAVALAMLAVGSATLATSLGVTRSVLTATPPEPTDPEAVVIDPGRVVGTTAPPAAPTTALPPNAAGPPSARPGVAYTSTTAIGDSVMVGAAPALARRMGSSVAVDAAVGRQMDDAVGLVAGLAAEGSLGRVVLVNLGANGPFSAAEVEALVAAAGPDRLVLLVNVVVPRRWEAEVNEQIDATAARHANVEVVDWRSLALHEQGLLREDGYHLSANGAERYTDLVVGYIPAAGMAPG